MQASENSHENYNTQPIRFYEKIGSTIFTVNIHHGTQKSESLDDKILRMMRSDLKIGGQPAIITLPQADWLPERGSL